MEKILRCGNFIGHRYNGRISKINLGLFICIFLLFTIISPAAVKAAETVAEIKVDNKIAQPGETVNVEVNVIEGLQRLNLAGYIFKITYDPTLIEIVGEVNGNAGYLEANTSVPGEILVLAATYEGVSGNVKLFDFNVKALGPAGNCPLTLIVNNFSDADLNDIPFTVTNGSVTIGQEQPNAPSVSADDENNLIIGINDTMEYKIDDNNYVSYDSAHIPDLSGTHTVLVRIAATGTSLASNPTTLHFTSNPVPVKPAAPNVTIDDTNNTVTGMAVGMEYNLDGTGYVAYDAAAFNAIDFSGAHTLLVRVAAEGINPPSDAVTLTFTENAETSPLIVSVADATGSAGEEIQVPINLQNVQQAINGTDGLANSNFKILYDSQYLEVISVTPGSLFGTPSDFSVNKQVPGELVFLSQDDSFGDRLITSDGVYAIINFRIKPETPIGEYPITFAADPKLFNNLKISSYELVKVVPTTIGSKITVSFVVGDVNGDKAFDVTDFGYMKLFLLGKITSFSSPYGMNAANVDGQGTVPDVTDFGYMKLRLLGKIPKFPIE